MTIRVVDGDGQATVIFLQIFFSVSGGMDLGMMQFSQK